MKIDRNEQYIKLSQRIIAEFGGPVMVGKLFDIKRTTVYQWARQGIPKFAFMYLEERFKQKVRKIINEFKEAQVA